MSDPYTPEGQRIAPNPHNVRLHEVPCDHCEGTGWANGVFCGSCMGKGKVQENQPRPGAVEAELRRESEAD